MRKALVVGVAVAVEIYKKGQQKQERDAQIEKEGKRRL